MNIFECQKIGIPKYPIRLLRKRPKN